VTKTTINISCVYILLSRLLLILYDKYTHIFKKTLEQKTNNVSRALTIVAFRPITLQLTDPLITLGGRIGIRGATSGTTDFRLLSRGAATGQGRGAHSQIRRQYQTATGRRRRWQTSQLRADQLATSVPGVPTTVMGAGRLNAEHSRLRVPAAVGHQPFLATVHVQPVNVVRVVAQAQPRFRRRFAVIPYPARQYAQLLSSFTKRPIQSVWLVKFLFSKYTFSP